MARRITICMACISIGLMLAGPTLGEIDPDTILGLWPLDEGSGDLTEDISGNENHGTLMSAPTWIPGQFGGALAFDGSSAYVNCGNDEMLNVEVFSVSFWCNIAATQG